MKICLINNLYKPFNRGGAEKVTETIAEGLVKAGYEVIIISTKPRGKKYKIQSASWRTKYKIYYLNSLYFNLNKLPKFFRLVWHARDMFNVVNYFKIKKILKKEKCDVVITNNLMGVGYLTALAIKRLKIKHIHIVHDIQLIHPSGIIYYGQENIINGYFAGIYAGLMSRLLDSPNIVIFPSLWLRNIHLEKIFFIKSKRLILPNPAPPPHSLPLGKKGKERRGDGIFRFLYLGLIEKHKGVILMIEAFKKISLKYPGLELAIAGAGSQLENAKQAAANCGNIKFLGWLDDRGVNEFLSAGDCLIYPSLCYENCPNAIQRALAAGLPVLASEIGGIPELLSKNAGLLFKPADEADLIEKMEWLIKNKNNLQNLIEAGKEKAVFCQADNYIKELESLLK